MKNTDCPAYIMWTSTCNSEQKTSWQPNHFILLDLAVSKPEQLIEVKIAEPLGTSDHDNVELKVPVRTDEEKKNGKMNTLTTEMLISRL